MRLSLDTFLTTDQIQLPGLLYEPEKSQTKKVAICLHGMGDNGIFYKPKWTNALAEASCNEDISFFAFNNRGAHNSKNLKKYISNSDETEVYPGGTHFEKIEDCAKDINGAIDYLKTKGYNEFYLIGHSTGANKICNYHANNSQNIFKKYVLAGPGDDIGNSYVELGDKKFWQAIEYAKKCIKNNQPLKIMPAYTGMHPFSAQSADDILDPDGDYNTFPFYEAHTKRLGHKKLFEEYNQIDIPTLVIFGEADEYTYTAGGTLNALDIMKEFTDSKFIHEFEYSIIPSADHGFRGKEKEFAEKVAQWLSK